MSARTWNEKITPLLERVAEDGLPYFEILVDGHTLVSLMTIDVGGDNTLVHLTRRDANRLIRRLQRAVDSLPRKQTRAIAKLRGRGK